VGCSQKKKKKKKKKKKSYQKRFVDCSGFTCLYVGLAILSNPDPNPYDSMESNHLQFCTE
jgi:hypothetical protein